MKTTKPQSKSNRVFLVEPFAAPSYEFRSVSEERGDDRRRLHLLGRRDAAVRLRSPLVALVGGVIR